MYPRRGGACIVAVNYCNCDIPWQVAVNLLATPVPFKCKKPGAFGIEQNGQELTHGKDVLFIMFYRLIITGYLFQTVYISLTLVYMPRLLEIIFCIIVIIIESFNPINRRRPTILLVSFHIIFNRAIFGLFFYLSCFNLLLD